VRKAEREWLESSSGEFLEFFQKYFSSSCAVTNIGEFIDSFQDIKTHFVHLANAEKRGIGTPKKI